MKDLIRKTWLKFFEERGRRERLQKTAISMVLIAAVVSATVYVAVTPAHTLEAEASLSCGREEHVHAEGCFTEQALLTCGLEESAEEHTHTEECYGSESVLTCTLEEHTHGEECYTQVAETPLEETEEETDMPGTQAPEETGKTEDTVIPEEETEKELPEETEEEATPSEVEEATPSEAPEATPSEPEGDVEYSVTLSDGLVITMTGPADAFPEGTLTMRAVELHEGDEGFEAASRLLSGETEGEIVLEQRIFDICLLDEDGNEVQPQKEVKVTFSQVLNGEEQGVQIHHLDTEANVAESIDTFVDGEDISMETGHFSYYSVTLAGGGVATIGEKSYKTLAEAVKAVKNEETIVLQQDIEEDNIKVSKSVNFTIDVNGYTWKGIKNDLFIFYTNGVEVTLTGGEKGGTLQAASGKRVVTINNRKNCTISIEKLKLLGNGSYTNGGILYTSNTSNNPGLTVTIKGCELTGGNTTANGGALYICGASLVAEDCIFEENTSLSSGAVFLNGSCTGSFTNCRFLKNKATSSSQKGGGAITLYGGSGKEVSLKIEKCEFTENTSANYGGAVYFASKEPKKLGTLLITDTVFSKNQSIKHGGALYIGNGETQISGSQFLENHAEGNKTSGGYGGALYVGEGSFGYTYGVNIQDSIFKNNEALFGGAIGSNLGPKQTLRLSNVTAEENNASRTGGAVYDCSGTADTKVEIADCKVQNNTAGYTAGGVYSKSETVHITGESVIKENTAEGKSENYFSDTKEIVGGLYLNWRQPVSFKLDETSHIYKNKTQNENTIPNGKPVEIYLYAKEGGKLEGVFEKLENESGGNTITDSGSDYTLMKYLPQNDSDKHYYYNDVMEPERIYLDPAETHTHDGNAFVAKTLEEAVARAEEKHAEAIYICSPVSIAAGDEENLNTEEAITFTRCDENRNYLFQLKSGDEVTFEKTRINGNLVEADYALVLVSSGATLNIKGDTVIKAGKNVNPGNSSLGGGGLRVSGTLNMSGGSIQGNQSNGSGGGIYALHADLNFTGGSILDNETIRHGDGGGIYMSGGNLSITKGEGGSRTLIKGNKTVSGGGGICLYRGAHAEIYCADILNNASKLQGTQYACGGGIHVYSGASLKMKNLFMTDNYQLKKPSGTESLGHCALYSCPTGSMAIFQMNGALIADNRNDSDILFAYEKGKNTIAYVSDHVLGGSRANWSTPDLWGRESSFRTSSNVDPAAKETARAMAESEGVVMTGNWAYGYGTAIANNGTLVVGTEEMSLTVNKVWEDVNGNVITDTSKYEEVPENLRVYLMKSLNGAASELATEFTDAETQLNRGNRWSHTWEKLGDSEAVKWSVEENRDDAAGFDVEISEQQLDTSWPDVVQKHYIVTITNKEKSEVNIAVEKEWIDQDNANKWRPESITAELWRNDDDKNPFKTGTLDAENDWFYTFEKLPKYDSAGTKYTYTVKEIPVENYTGEISEPQKGEKGTTYTITNTAYGKVQLKKTLDSYNETLGGAMFVFDVKATLENEVIFNDVFTTDFKAPGTQTIDIGNFPVGTEITVEEVYSGSSYQLSGSNNTQKLTIQLNTEGTGVVDVLAEYINTYNDKLVPGAGVRNHYERNDGGWTGSQAVN